MKLIHKLLANRSELVIQVGKIKLRYRVLKVLKKFNAKEAQTIIFSQSTEPGRFLIHHTKFLSRIKCFKKQELVSKFVRYTSKRIISLKKYFELKYYTRTVNKYYVMKKSTFSN